MRSITIPAIAAAIVLSATPVRSQDLDRGQRLAERWCAECHAIGSKPTRFRRAPSLAAIARKETVSSETLRSFLLLPHATMTNVPLSRSDAEDIAAFIMAMKP